MKIKQNQLSLAIIDAYSFYKAGLLVREKSQTKDLTGQAIFNMIPSTVNFCLSAELMLKILISQNNLEFYKTHKLIDLFNANPVYLKTAIYEAYKLLDPVDETTFHDKIESISDAFVEWRYYGVNDWQGDKNLEFEFVYCFSTILKNVVLAINKKTAELIKKIDTN